jgi:hypothetical protein
MADDHHSKRISFERLPEKFTRPPAYKRDTKNYFSGKIQIVREDQFEA